MCLVISSTSSKEFQIFKWHRHALRKFHDNHTTEILIRNFVNKELNFNDLITKYLQTDGKPPTFLLPILKINPLMFANNTNFISLDTIEFCLINLIFTQTIDLLFCLPREKSSRKASSKFI